LQITIEARTDFLAFAPLWLLQRFSRLRSVGTFTHKGKGKTWETPVMYKRQILAAERRSMRCQLSVWS